MARLFDDAKAASIVELIQLLEKVTAKGASLRWYRGQARSEWQLTPSITRPPLKVESESALIKRFKQNAYALPDRAPKDEWEWLFLMQHHGLPTRLLDWSENPLVALYFAVCSQKEEDRKADGALWCLDPIGLNNAAFVQPSVEGELPFFGIDREIDSYGSESARTANNKRPPAAALAPRYFPRLIAQAGVFTIIHRGTQQVDEVEDGKYVGKIVISAGAKVVLENELKLLGITRLALFPELDTAAAIAKEQLL